MAFLKMAFVIMYLFSFSETTQKLDCMIGSTTNTLTEYPVNEEENPFFLDNDFISAQIVVRVKDEQDPLKYFKGKSRRFAFQFAVKFKQEHTADDLAFGVECETPINVPHGIWMAESMARIINPGLQISLNGDNPSVQSPVLSAMNTVNVQRVNMEDAGVKIDFTQELVEDNSLLFTDVDVGVKVDDANARRKYFQNEKGDRVVFSTENLYQFEHFSPVINFNTFDLSLGMKINMRRYTGNQPLKYSLKSKKYGPLFWIMMDLKEKED